MGENPSEKLDIKMNPDGSGQLYVPGLTEFIVQSPEDINKVSPSSTMGWLLPEYDVCLLSMKW